ncbi:MAG TPA: HEPN domain-containing protein [Acetivibrio sp.]|nr:HEPN domain-containing protein [Acetivibrio sp.]
MTSKTTMEDALNMLKSFITSLKGKGDLSKRQLEFFESGMLFRHDDEGSLPLDHEEANEGYLALDHEEANEYRECLNKLYYSKEIYKLHSRKAVELLMQEAILRALDINHERPDKPFDDRLSEAIKELKSKLQVPPTLWTVHMRIEGLALEGLPYKFGKVKFCVADEHNLEKLKDKYVAIFDSMTASPFEDFIKEHFLGFAIASVNVSACDGKAAYSAAWHELRLTMDVINFYSKMLTSGPGLGAQLYFVGELQPTKEFSLAYETNGSSCSYIPREVGSFVPISFKGIEPSRVEKVGFYRINEILAKDNRSKIEERILASVQWAGRAAVELQQRPEEAFLHYAIALETIILGNQQNVELTYRLSMRTALLAGGTPEKRAKIKKEVKDLYSIRSKIVHSGLYEVTDADVGKIRSLAIICIMRVLNEKPFISMIKEQEIDDWFDQAMLSGRLLGDDAQP